MLKLSKISFGADPEGFLSLDGKIIGSEKLLPKRGKAVDKAGLLVRDGVQFELNPKSGGMTTLMSNIATLLIGVHGLAAEKGLDINYNGVVEVSREELDSLSEDSRVLGCQPSFNVYGDKPLTVDPTTYRKRSAGGHIHIGVYDKLVREQSTKLIALQDIIVGNTCVMLDRDPNAAERRENYGRAGEYRLPSYGVEYRTISNFWLRSPDLLRLILKLSYASVSILEHAINENKVLWNQLVNQVDIKQVQTAIDTSNAVLARANFMKIVPVLERYGIEQSFGVSPKSILDLVDRISNKGIDNVYPINAIPLSWEAVREKDVWI